jgi:hypothetical protein
MISLKDVKGNDKNWKNEDGSICCLAQCDSLFIGLISMLARCFQGFLLKLNSLRTPKTEISKTRA